MNHIAVAIVIVALIPAIIYCATIEQYWLMAFFIICFLSIKSERDCHDRD